MGARNSAIVVLLAGLFSGFIAGLIFAQFFSLHLGLRKEMSWIEMVCVFARNSALAALIFIGGISFALAELSLSRSSFYHRLDKPFDPFYKGIASFWSKLRLKPPFRGCYLSLIAFPLACFFIVFFPALYFSLFILIRKEVFPFRSFYPTRL